MSTFAPDATPEQHAQWAAERAVIVAGFLAEWRALRCSACGHGEDLTTESVTAYTQAGWPHHCDKEMVLVPREEA